MGDEKTTSIKSGTPFSYHTFLFPFLWKDDKNIKKRKDFIKCLNLKKWNIEIFDSKNISEEQFSEKYNQYHYFNSAARNAIYSDNSENEVVLTYKYNLPDINKTKYVIKINEAEKYELSLNGIRLKLFNTGIGILIFELENYTYEKAKDINRINDFGRRIYMPFSAEEDRTCSQCAENIYLTYDNKNIFGDSAEGIQKPETFDTIRIAPIIKQLLTNGEYSIATDKKYESKKTFFIEPVIDDRMFVACYYRNAQIADAMKVWDNGNYAYLNAITAAPLERDNEFNIASEIYKLIFIDGDGLTCQSKNLVSKMLGERYIYDRWIEYGSITGVTEYSFVTITNSSDEVFARNFLTEYVEMLILALSQRATLLNFERMLSESALNKNDIRKIHRSYLYFQSQLLLKEVTPQQQGIELYKMMLENMFINERIAEIENQIEDAFAQKTADSEFSENILLLIIAFLGCIETISNIFSWVQGSSLNLGIFVGLLVLLLVYLLSKKRAAY